MMKILFAALLLISCSYVLIQPGNAHADICENHVSANTRLCSDLYQAFQAALVKNEANLYNLRKISFPSSEVAPKLLNVSYRLTVDRIPENSCVDDDNSTDYLNVSKPLYINYGWTSITIYTMFHPATINRLQPQLFYIMMRFFEPDRSGNKEAAFYWEGRGSFLTLELFLDNINLPCSPSEKQVDNTLKDMTSVLKAYATDQTNLTEWKKSSSYVLDGRIFAENWWDYEDDVYRVGSYLRLINWGASFLLTFSLTIFFAVVLLMCAPNQDNTQYHIYHSLLWSSTGILSVWWVILYGTEIAKVIQWQGYSTDGELILNIFWLLYTVLLTLLYSLIFLFKFPDIDILSPSQAAIGGIFFCVCRLDEIIVIFLKKFKAICSKDKAVRRKHMAKNSPRMTPVIIFFLSAGFVIINIVPVIIYFLLYPIRVLSFYSFFFATFVLLIFVLTATDFERKRHKYIIGKKRNDFIQKFRSKMYIFVPFFVQFLIALVGLLFVVIYRTIVSGGSTGTSLYNLFKALIPTILISSPAIWLWRRMKKYYLNGFHVHNKGIQQTESEVTGTYTQTDNDTQSVRPETETETTEEVTGITIQTDEAQSVRPETVEASVEVHNNTQSVTPETETDDTEESEDTEEVTDITSQTNNPFDSERDNHLQERMPLLPLPINRSVNYSQ